MALFPPFVRSTADAVAQRLAKARTWALQHPRAVGSIVGGLTAPAEPGILSGFQAGLGGAYYGGQQYDQMTHQREQEAIKDAYTRALTERALREPMVNKNDLLEMTPGEFSTYSERYRQIHPEAQKADPVAAAEAMARFKAAHPEWFPDETNSETVTETLERDKLGYPIKQRTYRVTRKTPGSYTPEADLNSLIDNSNSQEGLSAMALGKFGSDVKQDSGLRARLRARAAARLQAIQPPAAGGPR